MKLQLLILKKENVGYKCLKKNVTYFIFSIFLVSAIYIDHVTDIAIPHIVFFSWDLP